MKPAVDAQHVLVENSTGNSTIDPSPPLAVLPLDPSAKLDQEPNPFEKSFSSTATQSLPVSKAISMKHSRKDPWGSSFGQSDYTAAPSYGSMTTVADYRSLSKTTKPEPSSDRSPQKEKTSFGAKQGESSPPESKKTADDKEKRRNFLERNRLAALKCRQRKKQWLNQLQARVEELSAENEQMQMQVTSLNDELNQLKTVILNHEECPVFQQSAHVKHTIARYQQQGHQPPSHSFSARQPPPQPPPPPDASAVMMDYVYPPYIGSLAGMAPVTTVYAPSSLAGFSMPTAPSDGQIPSSSSPSMPTRSRPTFPRPPTTLIPPGYPGGGYS